MGTILVPLLEYYDVGEKPQQDKSNLLIEGSPVYFWDRVKLAFAFVDSLLSSVLVQ